MISKSRQKLPYRKNCEGYLFYKGKILARYTPKGFLVFPGGGSDENETPEITLRREAFEETGAVLEKKLIYLGKLNFDWDKNWAWTDKQKMRYKQFRGEEIHFFTGKIIKFKEPYGDPLDVWTGEKLMEIQKAVEILMGGKPFPKSVKEYREMQLKSLMQLKQR